MRSLGHVTVAAVLATAMAVWPVTVSAGDGRQAGAPAIVESVTAAVLDPSLRSPLAAQTFEAAAEVADDRKQVTTKLGFPLARGWSGEAGLAATFDHEVAASRPVSLRRLTDSTSLWGAATWVRPRTHRRVAPFLGTRAEISRDEFDFYDTALTAHRDSHPAYALSATTGLLLPRGSLAAVTYRWLQAWEVEAGSRACRAQRGRVVCPVDRLFQLPSPQPRRQLDAQWQTHIGDKVGAALFVTRDFTDDAWGMEVPVYFIAKRDSGFTGGMVVSYNGNLERFDVALFVGQVFRLFK
jgi:hypothetical protein